MKKSRAWLRGSNYDRAINLAKEHGYEFVRASQCANGLYPNFWYVGDLPDDFPVSWSETGEKIYLDDRIYVIHVGGPYYRAYGFDSPDMHYSLYLRKETI